MEKNSVRITMISVNWEDAYILQYGAITSYYKSQGSVEANIGEDVALLGMDKKCEVIGNGIKVIWG